MSNNYKEIPNKYTKNSGVYKAEGLPTVTHSYGIIKDREGIFQSNYNATGEIGFYPIVEGVPPNSLTLALFYPKGKRPSCLPPKPDIDIDFASKFVKVFLFTQ